MSGKSFDKNFTDIMKHYRNQPQAASHVYRSVLLRPRPLLAATETMDTGLGTGNPPPTPTRLAATSTIADGEERGDLIKFYNTGTTASHGTYCLKKTKKCLAPTTTGY